MVFARKVGIITSMQNLSLVFAQPDASADEYLMQVTL